MEVIMKKAFTLAEVLVTLGIIGVVSAMTVPTLMQNHQRKTYVTQLHKIYNELSQALVRYQNDKNALNLTEAGLTSEVASQNFLKEYFNVVSECETLTTPCFASEYKTMTGSTITEAYVEFNHKAYVLANGISIRPLYSKANDKILNIIVDINGQKGPNILGRDFFLVNVYNNGMIDSWSNGVVSAPLTEEQREAAGIIYKPFGQILNDNWEMTY